VPVAAYEAAIAHLSRAGDRVVLGPSADGGYYLIGMKHAHAVLFERIHWSTGSVARETRERAAEAGIELVELPLWYDVDDAETLAVLNAELLVGMAPGFATMAGYPAPHTREFLLTLDVSLTPPANTRPADGPTVEARDSPAQASQGRTP
jgi:hypothetical protein